MSNFNLKIVSFDETIIDDSIEFCSITTLTGKMGFEARHEPFISILKENSSITYRTNDKKEFIVEIVNGLFTFQDGAASATVFPKK